MNDERVKALARDAAGKCLNKSFAEWRLTIADAIRMALFDLINENELLRDELGITGEYKESGPRSDEDKEILKRQATPFKELYISSDRHQELETKLKIAMAQNRQQDAALRYIRQTITEALIAPKGE